MWINEDGDYKSNKATDNILEFCRRDWPGKRFYTADGALAQFEGHINAVETVTLTRQAERQQVDEEGVPVLDGNGDPVMEVYEQPYREQVSMGNTHEVLGNAVLLKNAAGEMVGQIPLTLAFDPNA